MNISTEAAIAIIVAGFALIGTLYNGRGVKALQTIIDELVKDIERRKKKEKVFQARCVRYLKRIAYLTEGIRVLLDQVRRHDEPPCWEPENWEIEDDDEEELNAE